MNYTLTKQLTIAENGADHLVRRQSGGTSPDNVRDMLTSSDPIATSRPAPTRLDIRFAGGLHLSLSNGAPSLFDELEELAFQRIQA